MAKDPKRSEAGKRGAVARWGEPRVVRLDDLTPAQRRVVLAFVAMMQEWNDPDFNQRIATGRRQLKEGERVEFEAEDG